MRCASQSNPRLADAVFAGYVLGWAVSAVGDTTTLTARVPCERIMQTVYDELDGGEDSLCQCKHLSISTPPWLEQTT